MRRLAILLAALLVACSTSEPPPRPYTLEDLEHLVLREGPEGTTRLTFEAKTIGDLARGSDERRDRFASAGLQGAHESAFFPGIESEAPSGFMLTSIVYLFDDPARGLEVVEETVRAEGSELRRTGPPVDGRDGFTLSGTLDENLPPGVLYAWVKRNVVIVLAAVASEEIETGPLRLIARRLDAQEPPEGPDSRP